MTLQLGYQTEEERFVLHVLGTHAQTRSGHMGVRKSELGRLFRTRFKKRMLTNALLNRLIDEGKVVAAMIDCVRGRRGQRKPELLETIPDPYVPRCYNPMLYLPGHTPRWHPEASGSRTNTRLLRLLARKNTESVIA